MTYQSKPFSGLMHLSPGTSAEGLLENFVLAETRAHLAGSQDEKNNAFRAANVSLALAMEKYAYYHLLQQDPNTKRRRAETDSVDMGYSANGEKLLETSVVRTGFYKQDDQGELVEYIPTNFVCDHTGISVALPEQTQENYELGRFRNPVNVEHAFQEYAMRIGCPELSFEGFEELCLQAGQKLVDAQPALEKVS